MHKVIIHQFCPDACIIMAYFLLAAALRTSSVTLGNDATGYSTSQGEHHKNKQVDTEFLTNASRMGADLKSKLSQTNYVLGDEKPDFTTTNSYAARKRKDAQRRNKQNLF
jgi:hypothetical protein